ncbi:maleylacetoacetate isomerase [Rhizorhapis suberifaciens]|uniref:Maleylpyruvate isomerase n=1 Tax=Rhizorhapis suberifaciens TaxID=13656 RepID=A0A840HS85_9SPHN|nr:maleylacetoacetate isomerase [Rhizorhapis suberifaciens]MBB4640428.1 maleylpyruvate isomerase [Rhizorhapis suberifaciens]
MGDLVLHGYSRSGTSYRTRIALNLKGLSYAQTTVDLRKGEQHSAAYRALNPQGLVPALETSSGLFTQSIAILEWLEEAYPDPPLLPSKLENRVIVRAMCGIVACDIHPVNNLRVLQELKHQFGATQAQIDGWRARWISAGFSALELMVAQHGRGFAFGDTPTLADCHLLPQVYGAERFGIDLSPFPAIAAAAAAARAVPAIAAADPELQPDAD